MIDNGRELVLNSPMQKETTTGRFIQVTMGYGEDAAGDLILLAGEDGKEEEFSGATSLISVALSYIEFVAMTVQKNIADEEIVKTTAEWSTSFSEIASLLQLVSTKLDDRVFIVEMNRAKTHEEVLAVLARYRTATN
jgi:hypothetical protein